MSYGFHLFRVPAGADPLEEYKKQLDEEEAVGLARLRGEDDLGPVDAPDERPRERLVAALLVQDPEFKPFRPDYARIAQAESIDEAEARRRHGYAELTHLNLGVQVMLFDDSAAVTMPFWRLGREKAEMTLRVAWDCLKVLESEGGFSTYDTQIGKVLDLNFDFDKVFHTYGGMILTVDQTLRKQAARKRRWWKLR